MSDNRGGQEFPFKYRAFISYSHRDRKWAAWLHRALESYRIPKNLVGTNGRDGPVPSRIFPVYLDREESASSADLDAHIALALEQSATLIVICSPAAVTSHWVNEEILRFKRLGREARIFALIVDGVPHARNSGAGDPSLECFPEALRCSIGANGAAEPAQPLAADARHEGDGRSTAKLKLIAGILGIDFPALTRREAEAERRRRHSRDVIIVGMALLTMLSVTGGVAAYHYMLRSESATEAAIGVVGAILDKAVQESTRIGVSHALIDDLLVTADDQLNALYAKGLHTPRLDAQHAEIQLAFAEHYFITGNTGHRRASAQRAVQISGALSKQYPASANYRLLAARAHEALGRVLQEAGGTDAALREFRIEEAMLSGPNGSGPQNPDWQRHMALALQYSGDSFAEEEQYGRAIGAYDTSLQILRSIAARHPGYPKIPGTMSVIYERRAEILESTGHVRSAFDSYRAALEINQQLVIAGTDLRTSRYNVSTLNLNVGGTLVELGDTRGAAKYYQAGLDAANQLTQIEPDNKDWQLPSELAHESIAELDEITGRLDEALTIFRNLNSTAQHRLADDPANTSRKEGVAIFKSELGDTLQKKKLYREADAAYRASRTAFAQLIATDNSDDNYKHELAELLTQSGRNALSLRDLATAGKDASQARELLNHFKAEGQTDLGVPDAVAGVMELSAEVKSENANLAGAARDFDDALAIRTHLVGLDPANANWQERYAVLLSKMAGLEVRLGDAQRAGTNAGHAIAILKRLIALAPDNTDYHQELSQASNQLETASGIAPDQK